MRKSDDEIKHMVNHLRNTKTKCSDVYYVAMEKAKILEWAMGCEHQSIEKIGPTWVPSSNEPYHSLTKRQLKKIDELVEAVNKINKIVNAANDLSEDK